MAAVLKPGAVFVKKKHALHDTLKAVEDVSPEAIKLIALAIRDEKETMATRLKWSKELIDLQIRLADIISKDEFARQIAEFKALGLSQPLEPDESERKPSAPRLDMDTIQTVG